MLVIRDIYLLPINVQRVPPNVISVLVEPINVMMVNVKLVIPILGTLAFYVMLIVVRLLILVRPNL